MKRPPSTARAGRGAGRLLGVGLALAAGWGAAAQDAARHGVRTILDSQSFWRAHVTLRPELYGCATNPLPRAKPPLLVESSPAVGAPMNYTKEPALPPDQPRSPLPPADWMQPAFDDSAWWRTVGPFFVGETRTGRLGLLGVRHSSIAYRMPYGLALLCVRGRFLVTDPHRAGVLRFSAAYRGGIVVYLNGREIVRAHLLPAGRAGPETLAEDCPAESLTKPDSTPLTAKDLNPLYAKELHDAAEVQALWARVERRVRRLEGVVLPAALLRKGLNVLAIEVHRTTVAAEAPFCPTGLTEVELSTTSGVGIEPNIGRPAGVQVWAADLLEDVLTTDYGDPDCAGRPVRIVAARNGAFSGQIVVSAGSPITGLVATVSDLVNRSGPSRIAAARIELAYPAPQPGCARDLPRRRITDGVVPMAAHGFGALLPAPPAVVSVNKKGWAKATDTGFGAVQPIWVTVRVPKDAAAGLYEGAVTVSTRGQPPATVPLRVRVCEWTLPDNREYRTLADFVESPESLALHYGVPLWSDRHFALIDRSLSLLDAVGNRSIYIPLIAMTHLGNEESLIRWIRRQDGNHAYDFTVLDRYLDLCLRHMGRPRVLCFQVYDVHLGTGKRHSGWFGPGNGDYEKAASVPVTFLDPATGRIAIGEAPIYDDPAGRPAWQALSDGLWERLRARGLDKLATLGLVGDRLPPEEYVAFWRELLPSTGWAMHSHGLLRQMYGDVPIEYNAFVYGTRFAVDPACKRYYGWQREPPAGHYPRNFDPAQPHAAIRLLAEWNIHGNQNGLGQLPGDFLPMPTSRTDRPTYLYDRYNVQCWWGNTGLWRSGPWLAPGPEGAVSTIRLALLREGVQECEARILVERALLDETACALLGSELAGRAQALLDERTRYDQWAFPQVAAESGSASCVLPGNNLPVTWFAGSGWQDRSARLFELAGEVEAVLRSKGRSL